MYVSTKEDSLKPDGQNDLFLFMGPLHVGPTLTTITIITGSQRPASTSWRSFSHLTSFHDAINKHKSSTADLDLVIHPLQKKKKEKEKGGGPIDDEIIYRDGICS